MAVFSPEHSGGNAEQAEGTSSSNVPSSTNPAAESAPIEQKTAQGIISGNLAGQELNSTLSQFSPAQQMEVAGYLRHGLEDVSSNLVERSPVIMAVPLLNQVGH